MKVLYLHANAIASITEVDKLSKLKYLRNLTLHGNPMESQKNYKLEVVTRIPNLRHLDFSGITNEDRVRFH
jgi:Leucine-rich repeat (LRR) protein